MTASETKPVQEIAGGAWTRLRNLIAALDRVDRLETSSEFDGWLQTFATDEAGLQETIREFLLRSLRVAVDPVNWRILTHLNAGGSSTMSALLQVTSLRRVELVERINELARAGLTVQSLEGDQVERTLLAQGILSLIDDITDRMKALAGNDYVINPRAQFPKLPADRTAIRNLKSKI